MEKISTKPYRFAYPTPLTEIRSPLLGVRKIEKVRAPESRLDTLMRKFGARLRSFFSFGAQQGRQELKNRVRDLDRTMHGFLNQFAAAGKDDGKVFDAWRGVVKAAHNLDGLQTDANYLLFAKERSLAGKNSDTRALGSAWDKICVSFESQLPNIGEAPIRILERMNTMLGLLGSQQCADLSKAASKHPNLVDGLNVLKKMLIDTFTHRFSQIEEKVSASADGLGLQHVAELRKSAKLLREFARRATDGCGTSAMTNENAIKLALKMESRSFQILLSAFSRLDPASDAAVANGYLDAMRKVGVHAGEFEAKTGKSFFNEVCRQAYENMLIEETSAVVTLFNKIKVTDENRGLLKTLYPHLEQQHDRAFEERKPYFD